MTVREMAVECPVDHARYSCLGQPAGWLWELWYAFHRPHWSGR